MPAAGLEQGLKKKTTPEPTGSPATEKPFSRGRGGRGCCPPPRRGSGAGSARARPAPGSGGASRPPPARSPRLPPPLRRLLPAAPRLRLPGPPPRPSHQCGGYLPGGSGTAAAGRAGELRGRMTGVAAIVFLLQLLPRVEGQVFPGECRPLPRRGRPLPRGAARLSPPPAPLRGSPRIPGAGSSPRQPQLLPPAFLQPLGLAGSSRCQPRSPRRWRRPSEGG